MLCAVVISFTALSTNCCRENKKTGEASSVKIPRSNKNDDLFALCAAIDKAKESQKKSTNYPAKTVNYPRKTGVYFPTILKY